MLSSLRTLHAVPLKNVRSAIAYLRESAQTDHPLADCDLLTDRYDLFVEKTGEYLNISRAGQLEMKAQLLRCMRQVDRGVGGLPDRLRLPDPNNESIVAAEVDPEIRFWITDVVASRTPHRSAQERTERHRLSPRDAWVTDLVPTTDNIVQLVRAGRARWKIENEAFNTLKNQGYHLKHNFGHGDRHLSEALFVHPRQIQPAGVLHAPDLRLHRWSMTPACISAWSHFLQQAAIPAARSGTKCAIRLPAPLPRMAAIIVADSLYSKFVEKLTAGRFSFLLVAKPGDHKSLYQDVDGLRRGNLLDRHHTVHRGKRHEYEWVTGLPLNGSPDSPRINFIQFRIIKHGEVKYRNAWVTDLVPTTDNIVQLVRAARARWKIENEAFNTLKNQGYHLKHNFGHGDRHLSEALFVLNLLAFFMHQIFELVDGMYQRVRTFFSSRRAFWDEVRSAFRLFLFTSWDQVLERMNSPPEQLPPYGSR